MESIAQREASLTVVEMVDCVLPRMMPAGAAALIKRWYETKGIRIPGGIRLAQIDRDASGLHARLEGGETLDVDIIISATPVRPKIGLLAGSGIVTIPGSSSRTARRPMSRVSMPPAIAPRCWDSRPATALSTRSSSC